MEPRTITGSRAKIAGYLAIAIGFVAIGVWMMGDARKPSDVWVAWLCTGFFGLGIPIFGWLLIRPQVLRLDAQGFTLDGGFVRTPRTFLWRDIDRFYVLRLARGGKMVAFNYLPLRAPQSPLMGVARALGAEGSLPKGWSLSPEKLAALLTEYHAKGAKPDLAPAAPVPQIVS